MKKKKYIWMKVSRDIYEIPLIVEEDVNVLARKCGTKAAHIRSAVSHFEKNGKGTRFRRVEVEE